MAINTSNLTAYVEEHKLPLLRNAVIGSKTAKLFNLQTGCKGDTAINILNTDVTFGDGKSCGWNEAGTSALSQRIIRVGYPKVNMSFCDKQLLKYWTNFEVRLAAGQKTLPFEEDFLNGVVEGVAAKLEKALWQGDTAKSSDANLNKFDGMIKIIEAASIAATKTYASGATVASIVNDVYGALPSAVFEKGNVVMYMGSDMYRKYIQELVANGNIILKSDTNASLGNLAMPESILIPGTNVTVYGVAGLDGTGKVFASYAENFVYGTDLVGDEEKFELWYSQDNREFRCAIEFVAGVQIAFPDMVVEAKAQ